MSYVEEILGTRSVTYEQVYEYRLITQPTGGPAPSPEPGYEVVLVDTDLYGMDIYIEQRAYERAQP